MCPLAGAPAEEEIKYNGKWTRGAGPCSVFNTGGKHGKRVLTAEGAAMAIVAALAIAPAASPRAAIDARAAVASLALRWSTPRSGTAATAATVPFRRSPAATAVTATAAATTAAIFAAIADAAERRGV